jgi:hypothetical protein
LNGGSDTMTMQILLAAFVASLFPHSARMQYAAAAYVAIQLVLSYFVAGVAKLKQHEWRKGRALPQFLGRTGSPWLVRSWLVMLFECLFPVCLLSPTLTLAFLAFGSLFHLANFYYFGLNRFIFVWLAAYPALLLTSLEFRA